MLFSFLFGPVCGGSCGMLLCASGMSQRPLFLFLLPICVHFVLLFVSLIRILSFVSCILYPLSQNCPRDKSGCCRVGRIVAVVVEGWRGWGRGRWERSIVAVWLEAMVPPLGVRTVMRLGIVVLLWHGVSVQMK